MRSFQRAATLDPVPGDVVALLRRIDRASGVEERFFHQLPQLLDALGAQARVESVTSSSAIEGVLVDEIRVPRLVSRDPGRLRSRSEEEFAGYAAALDHLVRDEPGELSVGLVLHLHRLLFSHADGLGGSFKEEDNLVVDRHGDGSTTVRFRPVGWRETPFAVQELIVRTDAAFGREERHPLLVTAAFVLDLLCIHPFTDGNGRVARLLTTYLLQRHGYGVGRYVSIEALIYATKVDYYDALAQSTSGWFDDGAHDGWPWARYLLRRLAEAYDRFEAHLAAATSIGTKQQRVRDFVLTHGSASFTIGDIRRALPGVSDNTIRLVLTDLKRDGEIANDGTGRSARWHRTAR